MAPWYGGQRACLHLHLHFLTTSIQWKSWKLTRTTFVKISVFRDGLVGLNSITVFSRAPVVCFILSDFIVAGCVVCVLATRPLRQLDRPGTLRASVGGGA